jgi:hypothetical protein
MMKISRLGIFTLLLLTVVLGANCGFYNRVMARKSLVDGAKAYQERNFEEAEEKFRASVEYDPELSTLESKTAQLFLARTIHSEFAGNRSATGKAESAIKEYKKAMDGFLKQLDEQRAAAQANAQDEKAQKALKETENNIGSIVRAVASLYENLQQDDNWIEWQSTQAANEKLPNDVRAGAYVSLAAKEYACANDITDTEDIKKTVKEDGKDVFKFTKPENEEDFDKLKKCVDKGTDFIAKGVELNPESDSAWSYKASLIEQSRRIAEMNGETEKTASLKEEFAQAKKKFEELAEKRRLAEEAELKRIADEKAKKEGRKVKKTDKAEEKPAEEKPAEQKPAEQKPADAPAKKETDGDGE